MRPIFRRTGHLIAQNTTLSPRYMAPRPEEVIFFLHGYLHLNNSLSPDIFRWLNYAAYAKMVMGHYRRQYHKKRADI